ncbi:hypothetical protein NVP1171O_21 [Vibrio phage 1.171.O._10N.261.52.F12]|nr:hypothetical protein NVP1160O_22 [Vibrio phage 1.160.O._10N.261.48.B11]AUR92348.1 hypothetical protein NVP1171O_21 [Vibrio phage 1.171.O._10N.261.52.F12]
MRKEVVTGDTKIPGEWIPRIVDMKYCEFSGLYTIWFDGGCDGLVVDRHPTDTPPVESMNARSASSLPPSNLNHSVAPSNPVRFADSNCE